MVMQHPDTPIDKLFLFINNILHGYESLAMQVVKTKLRDDMN
jgi:hypothetical protein